MSSKNTGPRGEQGSTDGDASEEQPLRRRMSRRLSGTNIRRYSACLHGYTAIERAAKDNKVHAVVAGATGFLGAHITQQLFEHGGYTITATTRDMSTPRARELQERFGVDLAQLDMECEKGWQEAMEGADVVFIVAARIAIAKDSYGEDPADLVRENSQGALRMATAAIKQGVSHIVLTGSAGAVFGRPDAKEVFASVDTYSNVEYCVAKRQYYNASKTLSEKLVRKAAADANVRLTTVVPAMCVGPSVLANVPEDVIPESIRRWLIRPFRSGLVGDIDFYFCDYRDAAGVHVAAVEPDFIRKTKPVPEKTPRRRDTPAPQDYQNIASEDDIASEEATWSSSSDSRPMFHRVMALGWTPTHERAQQSNDDANPPPTIMRHISDQSAFFAEAGFQTPWMIPHCLGSYFLGGLARHQGRRFEGGYDDSDFKRLLGREPYPVAQTFRDTLVRLDEMGIMRRGEAHECHRRMIWVVHRGLRHLTVYIATLAILAAALALLQ